MDIISLKGLQVECVIGVWKWERQTRQKVVVNIDMATDIRKAAASDQLDDTLDYKGVSKRISSFVFDSEFNLVETLAEQIATILLVEFSLSWCRVQVEKPAALRGVRNVSITIERGEKS
ncbi:dihydroneopterin aldolase [Pseudomonadota bacterium]